MKFVSSIESFFCYIQVCKMSVVIVWYVAFYYASSLKWVNRGKDRSDAFRWKMHSGSFSYPISLAATEGTCSDLEYSDWSIPVSFILALFTLSLHGILAFFIELFQYIVYGRIVMLLYARDFFMVIHNVVYILHKSLSQRGEGKQYDVLAFIPLGFRNALRS